MPYRRTTLSKFIIEDQRKSANPQPDLTSLLNDIQTACKLIAVAASRGVLDPAKAATATAINADGDRQKPLDVISNAIMVATCEWGGQLAGMVSEEMEDPYQIPAQYPHGRYLLVFDPLDGSSNIDVNVPVGSIFSVLECPEGVTNPSEADFLQPGTKQVAAGYAIYGPSTMMVLTLGQGAHGFTLDPEIGEFLLTHPDMKVPAETKEFAINASNSRFWEAPVRRYVEECLAGSTGPRGRDFNMRWIASMVAEAHRILTRGGVFLYPRDTKDPGKAGRLRLLYEANPVGMLMEQAGGRASTGVGPMLEVEPSAPHQRIGLVFGSRSEVERIERYHAEPVPEPDSDTPLFNLRGLFRPGSN